MVSRSTVVVLVVLIFASVASVPASADPRCANNDPFYGHCIGGKILQEFTEAGGVGFFGNATTNELNTQNGGKYQKFDNTSRTIYWHPNVSNSHANYVGGLIRTKWINKGYELGVYGYPTQRESNARKPGKFSRFQGGGIYWAQGAPEAFAVLGGSQIEQTWAANDWENGYYGFPTSDEYDFEGGKKQNFQNGSIVWKPDGFPVDWQNDEDGVDVHPECTTSSCGEDGRESGGVAYQDLPTIPPGGYGEIPSGRSAQPAITQCPTNTNAIPEPAAPTGPTSQQTAPRNTSPNSTSPGPTSTATPSGERPVESSPSEQDSAARTPGLSPAATTTSGPTPTVNPSPTTTSPESTTPTDSLPSSNAPAPAEGDIGWCRIPTQPKTVTPPAGSQVQRVAGTLGCESKTGVWRGSSTQGCYLEPDAGYKLFNLRTGTELGRVEGIESLNVNPTWNNTQVFVEYEFEVTKLTEGMLVGSTISLSQSCISRVGQGGSPQTCTGTPDSLAEPLTLGGSYKVTSTFNPFANPTSSQLVYMQPTTRITFDNPLARPASGNAAHAPLRCDAAPRMRNTVGCVVDGVRPVWDLGKYDNLDAYSRHVALAQQSGALGVANLSGDGTTLTRTTNTQRIKQNRRDTCGGVTGDRTGGRSCDEYPMASTLQGGNPSGSSYPRTFEPFCGIRDTAINPLPDSSPPNRGPGYSVCLIDAGQNSSAGSLLGWFYTKNRVRDGDVFHVRPHPGS